MSTPEEICAALLGLGVKACLSDQDRQTIEIADGPIQRVSIDDPDSNPYFEDEYTIICFVPDPRIGPDFPEFEVGSVREKAFSVFGRVIGVRWDLREGFFLTPSLSGLSRNKVVTEGIIAGSAVTIS